MCVTEAGLPETICGTLLSPQFTVHCRIAWVPVTIADKFNVYMAKLFTVDAPLGRTLSGLLD